MKLLIPLLFICSVAFGQLDKVQTTNAPWTNNNIINENFDSLDVRVTRLIDSGSVVETVPFNEIRYDSVNSDFGLIIFSSDSIWCERPRGVFRRRLDE